MRFLIDFLNVLPTFTRTFATRYGLPARLSCRRVPSDDANRYFLFLRDSNLRALRNIFIGAKFIGNAPIYTNEKVAWKFMGYPGPWLGSAKCYEDRRTPLRSHGRETDDNVASPRRCVGAHDSASRSSGGESWQH